MSSEDRKRVVGDIFHSIGEGRPMDGLKHFTEDCVQHNPYVKGGMKELFDSMLDAMKSQPNEFVDPELKVRHVALEGDMLAAYTQLLADKADPSKGGLRQVHLFRFRGGKVCEYWDVTQMITTEMPSPANAF